ncbi:hypothetical protein NO2_0309 [Candidatus Termititenax persephonae]|uniref:Uncharacterized protein n=1 Tax=Candidatus Termititenax persephonae TaxID=2218525 RepID=A0A388TF35_9BACT|nr:hypothetical protein NO2_0309 [Candidatus Termititenax persephonae]
MKKIILGLLILGAVLSADKIYLTDGREVSGDLAIRANSFVVLGQEIDLVCPESIVDAVEKDGVKYTPRQYLKMRLLDETTDPADVWFAE